MQNKVGINWFKYASPKTFYPLAGKLIPWCAISAAILIIYGLYIGLFVAPTDFQQGEGYRIIFVHVPAAWFSMFLYLLMAMYAAMGLVFNAKLSYMMATAIAPTGAMFTFVALVTGSLWGKPMWGTYWVWDARLTSMLILLFLYAGYWALVTIGEDEEKALTAGAVIALVGWINIPIIKWSVEWWQTLHQPASILRFAKPAIHWTMLMPLMFMAIAFAAYGVALIAIRLRTEINCRKIRGIQMREDHKSHQKETA